MIRSSLALLVVIAACAKPDLQSSAGPEPVQTTSTFQTATFALG